MREIQHEIYKELYRKSTPKADFDKLFDSGYFQTNDWRKKYNIPHLTRSKIIDGICIRHKCTLSERRKIGTEVSLGFAPRDVFESMAKKTKLLKLKFPEEKKKKRKILKLFSWFAW